MSSSTTTRNRCEAASTTIVEASNAATVTCLPIIFGNNSGNSALNGAELTNSAIDSYSSDSYPNNLK